MIWPPMVTLLALFALITTLMVGTEGMNLRIIEALVAICLITGFAVAATV